MNARMKQNNQWLWRAHMLVVMLVVGGLSSSVYAQCNAAQRAQVCPGSTATVRVDGLAQSTNYALTYTIDGGNSFTLSITTDTNGNLDIVTRALTTADDAKVFNIVSISPQPAACGTTTPFTTLRVYSKPSGTSATATAVCSGSPVNYTITSTNGNTYNIATNSNGMAQPSGTVSAGNGKTNAELQDDVWQNHTSNVVNVVYTIVPVSLTNCAGDAYTITVPINPAPTGWNDLITRCSNATLSYSLQGNVNQTASGGNAIASTFSWRATQVDAALTGATTTVQTSATITDRIRNKTNSNKNVTYTITPTAQTTSCVGSSFTATISVSPEPVGVTDTPTFCSNSAMTYSLTNNTAVRGNGVAGTYSWVGTANANLSGISTTTKTTTTLNDKVINQTGTTQTAQYTVTPTSADGCEGDTFNVNVSINPQPVGTTATLTICSASSPAYTLQNAITNSVPSSFSWSATDNTSTTGESINAQSSTTLSDVLTNTTNVQQTVTYTVVPTSTLGCVGSSYSVSVNVNASAKVSLPATLSVCENATATFSLSGTAAYKPNGVLWSGGAGTFLNASSESTSYTYTTDEVGKTIALTLSANDPDGVGPCTQTSATVNVTINKLPVVGFTGLPASGEISQVASPIKLTANNKGGTFTIAPSPFAPSPLSGATVVFNLDQVTFNPQYASTTSSSAITYQYTDANGCTNRNIQNITVKPPDNVTFSLENVSGDTYCVNQGRIKLIGLPDISTSNNGNFVSLGSVDPIVNDGGVYYLRTDGLSPGIYSIQYNYNTATGSIFRKDITLVGAPTASYSSSTSVCVGSRITFTDTSTGDGGGGGIKNWLWNFGDSNNTYDAQRTLTSPSIQYGAIGDYAVTLKITSALGCTSTTAEKRISVVSVPIADFSYTGKCQSKATEFKYTGTGTPTQYVWDLGDGNTLTGGGNIPTGTHGGATTGTYQMPTHIYATARAFTVSLAISIGTGCQSQRVQKTVNIAPYQLLNVASSFSDNLNANTDNWFTESVSTTNSWVWQQPAASYSIYKADNEKIWWTGNRPNSATSYGVNETSYLYGPCLDISTLQLPMIAFNLYSNTEKDYDGVVLQGTTDNGKTWKIIGDVGSGINWYNNTAITSNPGNQSGLRIIGWSGVLGTMAWKRAALTIPAEYKVSLVQFRFAFTSNEANAISDANDDGFGVDNVFVGEKSKRMLVEYFTNTATSLSTANAKFDQLATGLPSNTQTIQYHLPYPDPSDDMYKLNPSDPTARQLFYNFSNVPPFYTVNGSSDLNGNLDLLTADYIDRQSLSRSPFQLQLRDVSATPSVIKVEATLVSDTLTTSPMQLILQAVLVERVRPIGSKSLSNVARKLLFGSDGAQITSSFITGQSITKQSDELSLKNFNLYNTPDNLQYILFLQDKNTKRIYQSISMNVPSKTTVVTALPEQETIRLFPNPAQEVVHVNYPSSYEGASYVVYDVYHRTVLSGALTQEIVVNTLPSGIYFMHIQGSSTAVLKFIVQPN